MKRWLRTSLINLAVLAGTLLVTGLVIEATLRVLKINTLSNVELVPGKGLRRIPGAFYVNRKEGYSEGRYNALGFRDFERQREKPAGTVRIEMFGDSFLEGLQVPLEQTIAAVLEKQLNVEPGGRPHEVLNLGQSGFGTAEEYLRFEHFGRELGPDVVIVALFVGNDIRNNSKVLNTESVTYYFSLEPDGRLALDSSIVDRYEAERSILQRAVQAVKRHSYLASFLSERLFLLRRGRQQERVRAVANQAAPRPEGGLSISDDLNLFVADAPQVWKDAWAVTLAILTKFRDEVESHGGRFAVMMIPTAEQIDPEGQKSAEAGAGCALDWDLPDSILEGYARAHQVRFLRLTPVFRESYARTGQTLYGFGGGNHGHWNDRGHALAAQALRQFLEQERLLEGTE